MGKKKDLSAAPSTAGSPFKQFAARRPRTTLLGVNVVGITVVVTVVEMLLRAWGMAPGYLDMGYDDFRPLPEGERLTVSREFYTDSLGIFRALPDSFRHRPGYHVNAWGFRGPAFDLQDSSRKRVMLIGDSFTWGATARPIDSSFADRLRLPGYQIFNLGIPGTNPDQYERMALHYMPLIHPDMVCVFFYAGNDVMLWPNDVVPYGNCYHITNVGWLNAYLEGPYIGGPEETYTYYVQRFNVPPNNWFNRFCALTVIGSRLWQVLDRLGWVDGKRLPQVQARKDASSAAATHGPYSGAHLRNIQRHCAEQGIPFRLFVIPRHHAIAPPDTVACPKMLGGLPYIYPEGLTKEDYYGRPDGHFNNSGHRKMAETILRELTRMP